MSAIVLELIAGNDPAFDGRCYWSSTRSYGGTPVSVRWVAEGDNLKNATQFKDHAQRIFDNLDRICGRCTK